MRRPFILDTSICSASDKGNAERKTKPLVGFRFRFFGHMPKRVNSKFHEKTVQGCNCIYITREATLAHAKALLIFYNVRRLNRASWFKPGLSLAHLQGFKLHENMTFLTPLSWSYSTEIDLEVFLVYLLVETAIRAIMGSRIGIIQASLLFFISLCDRRIKLMNIFSRVHVE